MVTLSYSIIYSLIFYSILTWLSLPDILDFFDMICFIGLVVALHGKETTAGDFLVEDVLEAGLAQQIEQPLQSGEIA